MTRPPEFESWQKDLKAFLDSEEIAPPRALSQSVLSRVSLALNPSSAFVLKKLLAIHLVTGLLSLLICPQFGFGPIGGGHGIMSFVMQLGDWVCAAFCGAFFLGSTALVSLFVLKPEEARVVHRAALWQFPLITVFSFAALMGARGMTASLPSFNYSVLWGIGAAIAAVGIFEIGYRLQTKALVAK